MSVISSSFKPPGVWLPRLILNFGTAVWPQVRQLCRKSCGEWAMRSEVSPVLLCSSCPFSWLSCATAALVPLCYRPVGCSQLLLTPDLRCSPWAGEGTVGREFGSHLSILACLIVIRSCWLTLSSLPSMQLGGILLCPQLPDTGGLSLTLIASLRNHLSNRCALFLLA